MNGANIYLCYILLASEQVLTRVLKGSSIFFGKKLIICIHYNLELLKFSVTKKPRGVMCIMCL